MSQKKFHIKKEDQVIVLSGKDRKKTGRVLRIDPKSERAIVEGVNMIKRHTKPTNDNPQGSIVEKEASIHISNLQLLTSDGKGTRVGRKKNEEGKGWVRYSKKTGDIIK